MRTVTDDVTMESFIVEGSGVTEIRLRISDAVLIGADLDDLDLAIVHQAGQPGASVADALLALEALVRAAENGRPAS